MTLGCLPFFALPATLCFGLWWHGRPPHQPRAVVAAAAVPTLLAIAALPWVLLLAR